ncbi:S8 family serine peptidase [Flavicella sediminum]|uniref:S8 family serine peptidase n=1 Tax=Flavicella sediminum TaxID=2585141 RepID=UPI00111FA452|nr:S8 family serine peptidase [Flavicella sediminum]
MQKKYYFYIFIFFQTCLFGQTEDAWVYFKNKPNASSYLSNPISMLTQKALDRRSFHAIALDEKDVPLEEMYVSEIASSQGIIVKARSKWLNALHVQGTKKAINQLLTLTSVDSIQFANSSLNKSKNTNKKKLPNKFSTSLKETSNLTYGNAGNQIQMLEGDYLHDLGFKGENILIAILDSGFKGVETFDAFSNLRDGQTENGEILGGYSFVSRSTDIYVNAGNTHGLSVLSTIAGIVENEFQGTAPNAQFYLFSTEDHYNETPLEESLWVEAAERADSLGVSIINTSLGYSEFDNANYNYTYVHMNGSTTFISRGAELAASRGILLVTSAGNSGSSAWKYITAPADAPSVLTVGAVDENEEIANFSSFGPTADGRVKPNVVAQGKNVYVINGSGTIATSNGTSFSGPIMTGMAACLWQAFPNKTAQQIKSLIQESSDLYNNPTEQRGYGIPNFKAIYSSLGVSKIKKSEVLLIPTLVNSTFQIKSSELGKFCDVEIMDVSGKKMKCIDRVLPNREVDISNFKTGVYFVRINFGTEEELFFKIVKK